MQKNNMSMMNNLNKEESSKDKNTKRKSISMQIKTQKKEFKEKERKLHNELEETRMSLMAYQMHLDIERGNFDVIISEVRDEKLSLEKTVAEMRKTIDLGQDRVKNLETKNESLNKEIEEFKNQSNMESSGFIDDKKSTNSNKRDSADLLKINSQENSWILPSRSSQEEGEIQNKKSGFAKNEDQDAIQYVIGNEGEYDDEEDYDSFINNIRGDCSQKNRDLFVPKIASNIFRTSYFINLTK